MENVESEVAPEEAVPALILNSTEVRILGCLMEKQVTTPEQYPLSLNSLTNACNQKTSRHPVVSFSEDEVVQGLETLREKGLASMVATAGGHVPKYRNRIDETFSLTAGEKAILCVLLLRGPQTPGELRTRTDRMYKFSDIAACQEAINGLMNNVPYPLASMLPRESGRKERRFAHALEALPGHADKEEEAPAEPDPTPASELQDALTNEIAELRKQLEELREEFRAFKASFE